MLNEMAGTVETSEIQKRIQMLNDMSEADLRNEMRELKTVLLANPAATSLLLDTDIGLMVQALRKITKKEIEVASSPKKKATAPAKVKLTAEQLAAALDDDDF
jgi:hypothetical protein